MKILVVSDTHGALIDSIITTLKKEENIDIFIHCGDKYKDAEKLSEILNINTYYRVPGNCDYDIKNQKMSVILEIEGNRILITHGHMQHVKDGLNKLKKLSRDNHADIVLFGHTHISYNEIINNTLYFNPGSTILPKDGNASYGIININNGEIESKIKSIYS